MTADELIEACAMAAHGVNAAYCVAIGDTSQPSWNDAQAWQKESCRVGVRAVLANKDHGPAASHNGWLEHKMADGWKWGPAKDYEKKEHPCFMPYEDLPAEQRKKDDLFIATVRAVAKALSDQ